MKKLFVYIFMHLAVASVLGQPLPEKCELRIANEIWLRNFEQELDLDKKFNLIQLKIISDSLLPDYTDPDLNCDYKIRWVLVNDRRKDKGIILNEPVAAKRFKHKISANNIANYIVIGMPHWSRGFYCTDPEPLPRLTFVMMETKDKTLRREINQYFKIMRRQAAVSRR